MLVFTVKSPVSGSLVGASNSCRVFSITQSKPCSSTSIRLCGEQTSSHLWVHCTASHNHTHRQPYYTPFYHITHPSITPHTLLSHHTPFYHTTHPPITPHTLLSHHTPHTLLSHHIQISISICSHSAVALEQMMLTLE